MAEQISWNLSVSVVQGPKIQVARAVDVDAYDKLTVAVPGQDAAGTDTVNVDVQPSGAGKVSVLVISSSRYGDELTYDVDTGATGVILDQPQFLGGVGMIGLLDAPPKKLEFTNKLGVDNDAVITILVGRTAAS